MAARPTILLAAGGTGGHIFPAVAVAETLIARGSRVVLATDGRGAGFGDRVPGVEIRLISSSGTGGGLRRKAQGAVAIGVGTLQARRLLAEIRPACVIGFGGYPSVPTMLAATWRRTPTLIHEQNAVLGRANRLVAARAAAIATAFADTDGLPARRAGNVAHTGNPVRAEFSAARDVPYPAIGPNGEGVRVLVLGGSQGARIFSDVVPAAFADMPPTLRRRFAITQQCRPEDLERVRDAYAAMAMPATLAIFFDGVPDLMARSHVVVTRAGASTVSELCETGRPSILVPYAHATDDHQTANAQRMEAMGAAWLMPEGAFNPQSLTLRLEQFVNLPAKLRDAAAAAHAAGGLDAARRVADAAETLIRAGSGGGAGGVEIAREKAA